jgi:flavin reductase (DIM6/NTAB) family NADH-FMN oxidoreductase RutF
MATNTTRIPRKADFPVERIRRFLEPGPVVLLTSAWKGETDVMTLGWHTVLEFSPSLVGCVIARGNHSHGLVRGSGECAINIPPASLVDTVVDIGNCSGTEVDKFAAFGLTVEKARHVGAPLIAECFAQLECRVADRRLVRSLDFFVLEVLRARVALSPKCPQTLHYQGDGRFMVSGNSISRRARFTPEKL